RPDTNPSWELLKPLNDQVIQTTAGVRARLYCRELPVVYHAARKLVPALHHEAAAAASSDEHGYALYVHIGQGLKGAVALERRARYGPYLKPDNDGRTAPSSAASDGPLAAVHQDAHPRRSYHTVYHTVVDVPALAHWLTAQRNWEHVNVSIDPGLYLCEYTYYYSLRETKPSDVGWARRCGGRPVLFIHVPPVGHPYSLQQLTELVHDAVSWLVEYYATQSM
ncbi:hypothetical protein THASP1DRAFT_14021, partial [Thamnocephalis sphaerospora]